jgi:hypothetical protein
MGSGMHTKVEYGAGGALVNGSCFTIAGRRGVDRRADLLPGASWGH